MLCELLRMVGLDSWWERALCADRSTPTELLVQMDKGGRLYRQFGWSIIFVCCTKKAIERIPIFQFSSFPHQKKIFCHDAASEGGETSARCRYKADTSMKPCC